jgi:5-methylcytosine-specific restriction endonuclease McrA
MTVIEALAALEKPARPKRESDDQGIKRFYASWQWRHLRFDFLKGKARRCQCCGRTPADGIKIVVDHIKPVRHFWHLRLDPNNLQIFCDACNMGKSSRGADDFREAQK